MCQIACQLSDGCQYFAYNNATNNCQLLGSAVRSCDLLRGPPSPSVDTCDGTTTTIPTTANPVTTAVPTTDAPTTAAPTTAAPTTVSTATPDPTGTPVTPPTSTPATSNVSSKDVHRF